MSVFQGLEVPGNDRALSGRNDLTLSLAACKRLAWVRELALAAQTAHSADNKEEV